MEPVLIDENIQVQGEGAAEKRRKEYPLILRCLLLRRSFLRCLLFLCQPFLLAGLPVWLYPQ